MSIMNTHKTEIHKYGTSNFIMLRFACFTISTKFNSLHPYKNGRTKKAQT